MDGQADTAALEPTAEPASETGPLAEAGLETEPVAKVAGSGTRSPRTRWAIAGIVVAGTVAAVAFAAILLGARATPEALRYIPADVLAVAELRPEMPGDQHAAVGELLAHFPGFKDQSILDQKIDETLNLLVDRATNGETDYATEIEPLLAGPAYVGVRELADSPMGGGVIVVLTTDGTVDCDRLEGVESSTETYAGLEIRQWWGPDRSVVGCALDGKTLLLGDPASVRAAIDAKQSGDGVAATDFYQDAAKALRSDRLGSLVMNVDGLSAAVAQLDPTTAAALEALPAGSIPPWLAMSLWADPNGLIVEAIAAAPTPGDGASPAPSLGPARVSVLAPRLPATTVAVLEVHDLGSALVAGLGAAGADPETGAMLDELEAAAAMFGGLSGLTGWIGDTALVVTLEDGTPSGGLVVRATDPATAASTFDSLRNILVIAGSGSGISVDTVDHDGTEITLVDLGDLSGLLGELGGVSEAPGLDEPVVLAWAIEGDLAVVGLGEGFVASVLDTEAGSSLADSDAYRGAMELAGEANDGGGYVDLAAIVAFVGDQLEGAEAARWRTEIEPWLAPIEAAAFIAAREDGLGTSRFVLTVR